MRCARRCCAYCFLKSLTSRFRPPPARLRRGRCPGTLRLEHKNQIFRHRAGFSVSRISPKCTEPQRHRAPRHLKKFLAVASIRLLDIPLLHSRGGNNPPFIPRSNCRPRTGRRSLHRASGHCRPGRRLLCCAHPKAGRGHSTSARNSCNGAAETALVNTQLSRTELSTSPLLKAFF